MLAIAGGKGGCGKTTTTLGLARALPEPTVAADFDRDLPNLLALAGAHESDPAPCGAGGKPSARGEVRTDVPHPTDDGVALRPPPADDEASRRALRDLAAEGRAVLLDCPAGAGPLAAEPLREAAAVLLVSTLCAPSLRDAAKTGAMARALGTPVVGAVLTRTRLSPPATTELLGCPVLATVPEAGAPVLEAAGVRAAYTRLARGVRGEEVL
jgi:septum site-determining protein MinD